MAYEVDLAASEARHAVRALAGDTNPESEQLGDGEINLLLIVRGLTATSDPTSSWSTVQEIAAEACEMIAARLSAESEIVIDGISATKSTAAGEFRRRAQELRRRAQTGATPSFANPSAYSNTHVTGVDPLPELESS